MFILLTRKTDNGDILVNVDRIECILSWDEVTRVYFSADDYFEVKETSEYIANLITSIRNTKWRNN